MFQFIFRIIKYTFFSVFHKNLSALKIQLSNLFYIDKISPVNPQEPLSKLLFQVLHAPDKVHPVVDRM